MPFWAWNPLECIIKISNLEILWSINQVKSNWWIWCATLKEIQLILEWSSPMIIMLLWVPNCSEVSLFEARSLLIPLSKAICSLSASQCSVQPQMNILLYFMILKNLKWNLELLWRNWTVWLPKDIVSCLWGLWAICWIKKKTGDLAQKNYWIL